MGYDKGSDIDPTFTFKRFPCPLCETKGQVYYYDPIPITTPFDLTTPIMSPKIKQCSMCGGSGYTWHSKK